MLLASRGGLTSGAAERTAQGGASNYLNMQQGVNNTNATNQNQIAANDQQNKISMMSQIPGMQLGAAQYGSGLQEQNVQNQMGATQAQNQYNLGTYQTQVAGYGAQETANASLANPPKKAA